MVCCRVQLPRFSFEMICRGPITKLHCPVKRAQRVAFELAFRKLGLSLFLTVEQAGGAVDINSDNAV